MRIGYFDCFSGVSGDMILGALIDAGLDLQELEGELSKLKISGFKIDAEKTMKKGIAATKVNVHVRKRHGERHLSDIVELVDKSNLNSYVKIMSKNVFGLLAATEAKIHNRSIEDVHFHEVGGLDSIVDVIGSIIGIRMLGIETVYASKIPVGSGFVECQHGTLPVPAPAALELLKGIPVYSNGVEAELVTPTGIAILKNISKSFGSMPDMNLEIIGYGAGSRDLPIPNVLRLTIGETNGGEYLKDEVILIETNIDDMNPELYGNAIEILLKQGALDVYLTPVFMKKNRPGTMFSVLTVPDTLEAILATIFAETTALGIRIHRLERRKLARQTITVKTKFGEVGVKVSETGEEIKNIAPEYEDCKIIAAKRGIPLKKVYEEATAAARKMLSQ